jgi:hypothetical protein
MSFISLKQIIPKILANINFKEYLINKGYKYSPKKNLGNFKCYILNKEDSLSEIIFLSTLNAKEIYYSIPKGDQGTIIDFVKNRLDKNNEYTVFNPSVDPLIEACKVLVVYINQYGENSEKEKDMVSPDEMKMIKKITFSKYFKLQDFTNNDFFKHYGISEQASFHPTFKDKIYNSQGLNLNNTIYKDIVNTAYPLVDAQDNETGIFYNNVIEINKRKEEYSFFSEHTNKSGVWKSDSVTLKTNERRALTIVSSPKEALAHFDMFINKNTLQYFVFFELDSTSLKHLYNELKLQSSTLYLSSNITIKDLTNELKLLAYLINFQYDMHVEDIDNLYVNIRMSTSTDPTSKKMYSPFIKKIFSYNKSHVIETTNILGSSSTKHLENDLIDIKEISNPKGPAFLIRIPNSTKGLYNFIKIIADSFPLFFNICLEKPKYVTWIKQNEINHEKNKEKALNTLELVEQELIFVHKTRKT